MRLPLVAIAMTLIVSACASSPVSGVCEALKPDMPVKYHGKLIDPETKANIQKANARFQAACQ